MDCCLIHLITGNAVLSAILQGHRQELRRSMSSICSPSRRLAAVVVVMHPRNYYVLRQTSTINARRCVDNCGKQQPDRVSMSGDPFIDSAAGHTLRESLSVEANSQIHLVFPAQASINYLALDLGCPRSKLVSSKSQARRPRQIHLLEYQPKYPLFSTPRAGRNLVARLYQFI